MPLPIPAISAPFAEPIGVSLDARWVRAAQVVSVNGSPSLAGAVRLQRATQGDGQNVPPLTLDEARLLSESLIRQGMHSRRIVMAAPSQHATLTAIELPPRASGAPLEQIASVELSRLLRLEPGSFELALWELPRIQQQQRPGRTASGSYIAATATHASGEAMSAAFDGLDLAVTAMVPESLTIAKAAAMSPETRAVVSLTWSGLEMVVRSEDGTIVYHRALPELGLHRIYVAMKERMNLSHDAVDGAMEVIAAGDTAPGGAPLESHLRSMTAGVTRAVVEHADFAAVEVARSLAYAARFSPDCDQKAVRFVGEGASVPGMAERLTQQMGVDFSPLTCGEVLKVQAGAMRHMAARDLASAIGASLWTQDAAGRVAA